MESASFASKQTLSVNEERNKHYLKQLFNEIFFVVKCKKKNNTIRSRLVCMYIVHVLDRLFWHFSENSSAINLNFCPLGKNFRPFIMEKNSMLGQLSQKYQTRFCQLHKFYQTTYYRLFSPVFGHYQKFILANSWV